MATITKDHAIAIAKKLQGTLKTGAKHDRVQIYHEDRLIAQYGIRRGSKKDSPHPYIPSQLSVSKPECYRLASCDLSREAWIEKLRDKGLV
jgi:hypothetical protein